MKNLLLDPKDSSHRCENESIKIINKNSGKHIAKDVMNISIHSNGNFINMMKKIN